MLYANMNVLQGLIIFYPVKRQYMNVHFLFRIDVRMSFSYFSNGNLIYAVTVVLLSLFTVAKYIISKTIITKLNKNNSEHFDLSDAIRPDMKDNTNKKKIGKFKDELNTLVIKDVLALNPKIYSFNYIRGIYSPIIIKKIKKNVGL